MYKVTTIMVLFFAYFLLVPVVTANDDYIMDTSSIGESHNGVIDSEQLLEIGNADSAATLSLEGENFLHTGDIDRAIMVLQRSVEIAPGDIDARITYAQALEQKMLKEKSRNPALFNFCVKQWFYVAKKSEFMDQTILARSHLANLTGVAPRRGEKENKYLAKVTLPENTQTKIAVRATLLPHKQAVPSTKDKQTTVTP